MWDLGSCEAYLVSLAWDMCPSSVEHPKLLCRQDFIIGLLHMTSSNEFLCGTSGCICPKSMFDQLRYVTQPLSKSFSALSTHPSIPSLNLRLR